MNTKICIVSFFEDLSAMSAIAFYYVTLDGFTDVTLEDALEHYSTYDVHA